MAATPLAIWRPRTPRILMLEWGVAERQAAMAHLPRLGWHVRFIAEAQQVPSLVAGLRPDVVILPLLARGLRALGLCSQIRALADPPAVWLTSPDPETPLPEGWGAERILPPPTLWTHAGIPSAADWLAAASQPAHAGAPHGRRATPRGLARAATQSPAPTFLREGSHE